MKLKLDENMPRALVKLLQESNYDVSTAEDEGLRGADDHQIALAARTEERILISFDVGFGDVRAFPVGQHAGMVVFRLRDQRWAALEGPARRVVDSRLLDRLAGGLAIVDETRMRIRAGQERDS